MSAEEPDPMTDEERNGVSSPGSHPDLERLAELEGGALPDDEAADVRAHVDDCPGCRQRLVDVTATRALLAGLPREPLPDDVRARVLEGIAAPTAAETVVPDLRPARRRFPAGLLASAAAVIAVGALVAAVVVGGQRPKHSTGSTAAPAAKAPTGSFETTASGRTYTQESLPTLVRGLVAVHSGSASGQALNSAAAAPVPAALAAYRTPAGIARCLRVLQAGGPQSLPLAIDLGRFTNASHRADPAAVIVLPDAAPGKLSVFVEGPSCAAAGTDQLLYFARPDRAAP